MRELDDLVEEVKAALAAKQLEIRNSSTQMTFVLEAFKNRQMEVISFIRSATAPAKQRSSILEYKKAASELLGAISKILV